MSFIDVQERFAESLAAQREERHLTILEFCELVGIGPSSYDYYTRGSGMPTLDTAIMIAQRLGISLDELVGAERRAKRG